jgi:hypothetical protein
MRKSNLIVPSVILFINIIVIASILLAQASPGTSAEQHDPDTKVSGLNPVYLIIQYNPGDYQTQKIIIDAPVSGFEALESTGLNLEIEDFGDGSFAVCSIEGVGCPADDCFCGEEKFWNYEYWDGNTWQSYQVGAADSRISGGAIEGWRWGEFEADELPPADDIIPHE